MSDPERPDLQDSSVDDPKQTERKPVEVQTFGTGSPVPADAGAQMQQENSRRPAPIPAVPGRALTRPAQSPSRTDQSSGLQRAAAAVRVVLPMVQKVLPLLDGNIASVVSNILLNQSKAPAKANLAPVESALARLHVEQRELRGQVAEQNTSLKRVGDQLELVKEATDRNTLEQQELMEDLASIRKKMKVFAWTGLGLLVLSIVVNVILFLRLQRILP